MTSVQHPQSTYVHPPPAASEQHKRRRRRHRFLKAVILLTVPFYCLGFTLLAMLRVEALLQRAASSPLFLGGLLFFVFLLLIEPWTGTVSNGCAAGVKCASVGAADPMSCLSVFGGCLTVIGVLAGVVALAVWVL